MGIDESDDRFIRVLSPSKILLNSVQVRHYAYMMSLGVVIFSTRSRRLFACRQVSRSDIGGWETWRYVDRP